MRRTLVPMMMLAALVWAVPSQAEPLLTLIPDVGIMEGSPTDTVGWGYEFTNDDVDRWLVISSIATDPFEHGVGSDLPFDFPILAPGEVLTREFNLNNEGLYQFTWDVDAPAGFVNSGFFTVGAEWWDGDPFAGGQFLELAPSFVVAYQVGTAEPTSRVPEPSTWLLIMSGFALATVSLRRAPRPVPVRGRV